MNNKYFNYSLRGIIVLLTLLSTYFQVVKFVFGTLVKTNLYGINLFDFICHLSSIIICLWCIIHQISKSNTYLEKINRKLLIGLRVIFILIGFLSFIFQIFNFMFGTLVRKAMHNQSDMDFYINEVVPHVFTVFICVWFVFYQRNLLLHQK